MELISLNYEQRTEINSEVGTNQKQKRIPLLCAVLYLYALYKIGETY